MYNPSFGTFFMLVSELELPLNDMFEVSLLSMGELPCKEYVLMTEE